jgi:ADP-dependent phosphofructokinase/glucokinase
MEDNIDLLSSLILKLDNSIWDIDEYLTNYNSSIDAINDLKTSKELIVSARDMMLLMMKQLSKS